MTTDCANPVEMKRAAVGWAGLWLSLALAGCIGHGVRPAPEVEPRDWDEFWKVFQTAAAVHDRSALRPLMTAKFDYSFGDGAPTPEKAFAFWDRGEIGGWQALAGVAKTNAVEYVPPPQWELKGKVRLAPPQAAAPGYRGWRAVFERQTDGEWKFTAFLQGD